MGIALAALLAVSLWVVCGADRGPVQIIGQVFITTKNQASIKLGAVPVYLIEGEALPRPVLQ